MSEKEERISNQSMDLGEFNKERLLEMFPIFRTEGGGVDFDRLKLALGESVEVGKEVFGMRWPGKADSIRLANAPSHGTLSPDEKESVNFDTTQNLIIEGDNLEVLKLLQKSYQGKVKMIYIDPPYNTGNDFVYEDDFADGIKNYLQQTGQINEEGNRLSTNSETDGRFHSNWMNMMYPRLVLARNLLTQDGVIFISIDDNEHANLIQICAEVFGSNNYVASFIWRKKFSLSFVSNEYISVHEYVVAVRHCETLEPIDQRWNQRDTVTVNPVFKSQNGESIKIFRKGTRGREENFEIPIGPKMLGAQQIEFLDIAKFRNGELSADTRVKGRFAIGQEKLDALTSEIEMTASGSAYVIKDSKEKEIRPISIFFDYSGSSADEMLEIAAIRKSATTRTASAELEKLMGNSLFDNPKPVALIQFLIETFDVNSPGSIIMDFFAGSGTTAHAVMEQNAKDGGNRKFVLVQLPEQVDSESEAAKAGFDNIADITKERVRRAGKKIIEKSGGKLKLKGEVAPDFGFRVLKLNESNIEDWNSEEASKSPKDLLDALKTTRLKSGRCEQDVVFEVLVKFGIELTSTVEEQKLGKGSFWKIAGGELIVVVSPGLSITDLNSIAKMAPKVVVMLDEAFVPESLKTNARATFKDAKIELKTF